MNIYVGNLPWSMTEADLSSEFEAYGKVRSVQIIKDKLTDRSRGFGFVEMDSQSEAQAAIEALNGKDVDGRPLTVNEARPRAERRRPGRRCRPRPRRG